MSTLQIGLNGQIITLVSSPATERASVQFDLTDAVALVTSEFTGQVQAQQWPGADMLSGTMTWPPLTPAQANDVVAFLMQCRGMANSFLLGDPLRIAPTGSGSGFPFVDNTQNGGNPAGSQFLGTKGWTANAKSVLKRGDAFCTNWRLYYALDDVNADSSGKAVIPVWPSLREQPAQDGTFHGWQNATGTVVLNFGHPIGNPAYYAIWSNFALVPGVELPRDAVIQGIYPVMLASNNSDAISDSRYGVGLVPWFGGVGTPIPLPAAPYTNTEAYAASIGTSLAVLNGQQMLISLGATLANPFTGSFSIAGLGFAIYYTSAAPFTDATIPAPFAVPAGQGLAWAMPFTATYGSISPDNNGSATATGAILNGQIGLTRPQGLFRLASNKRTWSADPSLITRASFPVQEYR